MYIYKQYLFFVYIVTNHERTVLYIGVTNNLDARLSEHYFNKGIAKTFAGNSIAITWFIMKSFSSSMMQLQEKKN